MRIAYVLLNAYAMGGTVRTVFNQANAMAAKGHDVRIISVMRHRATTQFTLDPAVTLHPLFDKSLGVLRGCPLRTWVTSARARTAPGVEVPDQEARKSVFTREVEKAVIRALKHCKEDVLVSTRPALNLLTARYAPSTMLRVAQVHQHLKPRHTQLRNAIIADYPRLDAVVTLTEEDRADYMALLNNQVPVTRIPNSVPTLDAQPADLQSKVVIAAGRLVRAKGFDLLIAAFAKVVAHDRDWRLKIFGFGPMDNELANLIKSHGLRDNVFLMGRSRSLSEELAQASICALASRSEGLPMIVLEAFTHGLPVVSFAYPGADQIITHGQDGVLVPLGDVDALGDAISRLASDTQARIVMGDQAKRNVRAFGPDTVTAAWEDLFTDIAKARSLG